MTFEYFPESDMLYISLVVAPSVESAEISPGIVLDYNQEHRVVGIEIEDASQFVDLSRLELSALPIEELLVTRRATMPV